MSDNAERERQRNRDLANEDLGKPIPELLTDIRQAAINFESGQEGSPNTMTLYRHAALLAKLSQEADQQAARNLKINSDMLGLTRRFLLVSIVLMFAQLYIGYLQLKATHAPRQDDHVTQTSPAQPPPESNTKPHSALDSRLRERLFKFGILFAPHKVGGSFPRPVLNPTL
jgi:hypothetical protein